MKAKHHSVLTKLFAKRQLPLMALTACLCLPTPAISFDWFGLSTDNRSETLVLETVEPFMEMHTGPGRGYPVFHVIEQGETIEILKRKPGWYKIRSQDNKTGWTKATQLAHTLKPTGEPIDLPEIGQGDYLRSHWRVGFTAGQLEGSSTFSLTAGYRPFSWAGIEIEGGKIFDESVTSDYYGANLLIEPMTDWLISPFVTAGSGQFSFSSRQKVIVEEVDSPSYLQLGAGASYYIGRNVVLRAEYRRYSISTNDKDIGLNAWSLGLNTFF